MFNKILIANRGEIACRVIRTARQLGIHTVAVYSDADVNALHVKLADEAVHIGPSPSRESYLCIDRILAAALQTDAKAIHPGYGFLSENADFATACAEAEICFIGPPVAAIQAMGSKSAAKKLMEQAGVPLVPGYHGDKQDLATLRKAAKKIGYPILLKAVAGGGGKGMRIVAQETELEAALTSAKREALSSFGDDTILIEKYLLKPRHIEIQIFADTHGNVVHLFERDCSIQRRHQKIIEEAPAPGIQSSLREKMGGSAIAAARAINYVGAGTVEFLLDEDSAFYFMEMNTRLQVEHPVTEMITGQDLVAWQLHVAAGERLPLTQKQLAINGHAFEARIYAEDPYHDFLPTTGHLQHWITPAESAHVRMDAGVTQGDDVSMYYDPMLAKLIVWDIDRNSALHRLQSALANTIAMGVTTNVPFLNQIATHSAFATADIHTNFIPQHQTELFRRPIISTHVLAIACLFVLLRQNQQAQENAQHSTDPYSPWHVNDGWRLNAQGQQVLCFRDQDQEIRVLVIYDAANYIIHIPGQTRLVIHGTLVNAQTIHAEIIPLVSSHAKDEIDAQQYSALVVENAGQLIIVTGDEQHNLHVTTAAIAHSHEEVSTGHLTAPMPGTIVALLAKPGDKIEKGAGLIVLEAMKMEHTIYAPAAGVVKEFYFKVGDLVQEGLELLKFEII